MNKPFANQVCEGIEEINTLTNRLAIAEATTSRARNAETDLRNRLNAVQREFDVLVVGFRKLAPKDTDWKHYPKAQVPIS